MSEPAAAADPPAPIHPHSELEVDAEGYLALAEEVMGPAWAAPQTFRLGASSLLDALLAARDA